MPSTIRYRCLQVQYKVQDVARREIRISPDTTKIFWVNLMENLQDRPLAWKAQRYHDFKWFIVFLATKSEKQENIHKILSGSGMTEPQNAVWMRLTESQEVYHGTDQWSLRIFIFFSETCHKIPIPRIWRNFWARFMWTSLLPLNRNDVQLVQ